MTSELFKKLAFKMLPKNSGLTEDDITEQRMTDYAFFLPIAASMVSGALYGMASDGVRENLLKKYRVTVKHGLPEWLDDMSKRVAWSLTMDAEVNGKKFATSEEAEIYADAMAYVAFGTFAEPVRERLRELEMQYAAQNN